MFRAIKEEAERRKRERAEAIVSRRAARRAALPAEAPRGASEGGATALVRVRLPNGSNAQRSFSADSPLRALFDFVDSLDAITCWRYNLVSQMCSWRAVVVDLSIRTERASRGGLRAVVLTRVLGRGLLSLVALLLPSQGHLKEWPRGRLPPCEPQVSNYPRLVFTHPDAEGGQGATASPADAAADAVSKLPPSATLAEAGLAPHAALFVQPVLDDDDDEQ